MKSLPILSIVPRSGTRFLRYAVAFLSRLNREGRVDDRLTGRVLGDLAGSRFDFPVIEAELGRSLDGTCNGHGRYCGRRMKAA